MNQYAAKKLIDQRIERAVKRARARAGKPDKRKRSRELARAARLLIVTWAQVRHCCCIQPCSFGRPMLHFRKRDVECAADGMPVFISCSQCGSTPLPEVQPECVHDYLMQWLKLRMAFNLKEGRGVYDF